MQEIVPQSSQLQTTTNYPKAIVAAGSSAEFAWDEFFSGQIRNRHTRKAYLRAVERFLDWAQPYEVALAQITPGMVGSYFEQLDLSVPSTKLHLAAIRKFFDLLVLRHVVLLNPASSVRTERFSATEGKTPMIESTEAKLLFDSIKADSFTGMRDRAIIGTLLFTAARAGAIAKLTLGDYVTEGSQKLLRFTEKGGKARNIPVRHDLEQWLDAHLNVQDVLSDYQSKKQTAMFQTACGGKPTGRAMSGVDIWRVVKRRLKAAGLPENISPHSFRALAATDLLNQGIAIDSVQYLLGHADTRTTKLYDRRHQQITRNIVERITV